MQSRNLNHFDYTKNAIRFTYSVLLLCYALGDVSTSLRFAQHDNWWCSALGDPSTSFHFAQDDSVVNVMPTIYNVISTGVTRNGEIPTIWIIVRDLSASLRFGRDDKIMCHFEWNEPRECNREIPTACNIVILSEACAETKNPMIRNVMHIVMQCFATWDPSLHSG